MVDVFDEVEEELRAQRAVSWARRYLPWAALGLLIGLLVVGGLWGWREWERRGAEAASQTYAAGLEALAKGDSRAAEARFREVATGRSGAYESLAEMQIGGLRMTENKPAEAAAAFDRAAETAPDPVIGDAARLKAVFARMDAQPYAASVDQLTPLTEEGRPYRLTALEARALARIGAGQSQAAKSDLAVLSIAPTASDGMRRRAEALTALVDSGAAGSLAAVAKAALALPPAATAPMPGPAALPPPSSQPTPAAPAATGAAAQ